MFINTIENIKKRIIFKYIGKFYICSKKDYELFFINTIKNIIDMYNIKYFPRKIIIKFESKKYKSKGGYSYGGTWDNIFDCREKGKVAKLLLQAWNLPKNMYNEFLEKIVVHEIFHLFIPGIYYKDGSENSCFVEGFVEFLTYKYNNKLSSIIKEYIEYNKIKNKNYKEHKFPYIFTPYYMHKLLIKKPEKINNLINNMIYNFNNNYINYYKKYTKKDIIKYDKLFKKLFTKKCDNHIPHKLTK
jgi:hypothetical protein